MLGLLWQRNNPFLKEVVVSGFAITTNDFNHVSLQLLLNMSSSHNL